ncbi:MAG: rRNA ((1402)-N(4))-methyltransferase [Fibrobacteres bacterium]|nr:rRNA ((1402)-N(4))-methyltransferase [Fibrobacterota bacterium]
MTDGDVPTPPGPLQQPSQPRPPQAPQSPQPAQPTHKRRVRYRGTHPRGFGEKYKELDASRYEADFQKVIERGQTPAGTHRPICVDEILGILSPKPGEIGLDATLGFGGHAREFLPRIAPGGRLFGIDVDPLELPRTEQRLRAMGFTDAELVVHRMNFAGMGKLIAEAGRGFDFVLADLGVSSMQIDNPSRGFTFKADGPLDLRLNPTHGQPAAALLKTCSQGDLAMLLYANSDEPHAEDIANAVVARRGKIHSTLDLAEAVRAALKSLPKDIRERETKTSLQRTFQALRIAVNDEFGALDRLLASLPDCLAPGGRAAILTFHSGEDRRVKKSFQALAREGVYSSVAPEPIRPSAEERRSNPRSSCAKLRWAVRAPA